MTWRAGAAIAAALASAGVAAAADRAPAAPAVGKLLACRQLSDPTARLGCFDKEATALSGDVSSGNLMVVDKAQVRAAQRASFGLPPPGLELFAGKDGQRLARVETKVTAGMIDRFGKFVVTLTDGSRWHQIDDYALTRAPRAGDAAVISRAAFGSFKMSIAGQSAVKVVRDH